MSRVYKVLPWLIFAFAAIKILATVHARPLIAYANNWDFAREAACYGVWEHYPNGKDKTASNPEGPVNPLVYDGNRHPEWCVHVIDNVFIRSILAFHKLGDHIHLQTVGTLKAVFLLGMTSWLMVLLRKKSHQLAAALTFLLAFGDIAYLSFFNTLYAEFSMLAGAFLSLFGLLILGYDVRPRLSSVAFCIVSLLFLGLAKVQSMPLAVVTGMVMGIIVLLRRKGVALALLLITAAVAMPIGFNIANRRSDLIRTISYINLTNTVMVAVLPNTHDPVASMRKLGLPEHCSKAIGVPWWDPRVAEHLLCPELANLSRTKLLGLFFWDPTSFFRPMSLAINYIRPLQLNYLPNTENALVRNSERYRFLKLTSLSTALDALPPSTFFVLIVTSQVIGVASLLAIRRSSWALLCSAGGALIFYALFSSVFGDGLPEISKHGTAILLGICVEAVASLFYLGFSLAFLGQLAPKLKTRAPWSGPSGTPSRNMNRHVLRRYWVVVAVCIGTVLLLPAILDRPNYETCLSGAQWESDGGFVANGTPNPNDFPASVLQSPDIRFWRNYTRGRKMLAHLQSAPFIVRTNHVIIPVVGFPNAEDAGIYLESETGHQRFWIRDGAAHTKWQPFTLSLPKSLTNTPVRLIAFSKSTQTYVGVGTPYFRTNRVLPGLAFSKIFSAVCLSVAYLVLLFFPLFYWLSRSKTAALTERLLNCFVLTSLLSFSLFFLAFYFPSVGRFIAHMWLLLSGLLLAKIAITRSYLRWSGTPNYCLLILVALTVCQGLFLFSFNMVSVHYAANYLFYPASWSTDNQIPTTTARLLAHGTVLSEWAFGSWRLSDRTPLLTSLLYPAAVVMKDVAGHVGGDVDSMILQICGFGIQNCWLLPAWIVFRRLRFNRQECLLASLLLAATPFIFFNSVYIWPKLLTATFCLAQYLYLIPLPREPDPPDALKSSLGGAAAALAILSHAASDVAVLGVLIAAIYVCKSTRRSDPHTVSVWERVVVFESRWRWVLIFVLASTLVLLPWALWTKFGFTPSNALPKYFLTGSFGFERPDESVAYAAMRFYRTLTLKQWLTSKGLGLAALGGFYHGDLYKPLGMITNLSSALQAVRALQFFYMLPSLGLLLIPLAALLHALARKRIEGDIRKFIVGLGVAAIVSFVLQFVIMMSPHLLIHYPYYVPFSLHLLAVVGVVMLRASAPVRWAAVLNYTAFLFFWLVLPITKTSISSILALLASVGLILTATFILFKLLVKTPRASRLL